MKARKGLEGRSTLAAASRDSSSQDRVLRQIKTITKEIEALQTEIYSRMRNPEGLTFKKRSPAENASDARVLAQFKVSLDRLRHVLWFYIEQLAYQAGTNIHWEPLRLGCPTDPDGPVSTKTTLQDASDPAPGSFFDRLDVVVDSYVKPAPGQSGPRKRAKL